MATVRSRDGTSLQNHTEGACLLASSTLTLQTDTCPPLQDLAVLVRHHDRDRWTSGDFQMCELRTRLGLSGLCLHEVRGQGGVPAIVEANLSLMIGTGYALPGVMGCLLNSLSQFPPLGKISSLTPDLIQVTSCPWTYPHTILGLSKVFSPSTSLAID